MNLIVTFWFLGSGIMASDDTERERVGRGCPTGGYNGVKFDKPIILKQILVFNYYFKSGSKGSPLNDLCNCRRNSFQSCLMMTAICVQTIRSGITTSGKITSITTFSFRKLKEKKWSMKIEI